MKNLKVNKILKKLSKKAKLVLLTTSIVVGLTGCTSEDLFDKPTTSTPKVETANDQKTPTLDLSNPDSIEDAYYMEFYDSENGGIDKKEEQRGFVRELTKNGKKYLVDSADWNKVLISDYTKIGKPYRVDYYDSNDSDSARYVIDVKKGNYIETVDARNFGVLLTNLEYISDIDLWHAIDNAEYMEYYDSKNGGKDNDNKDESGYGNGYVYELTANDGRKWLLDASSLKVLLSGYDEKFDEEYMEYYDSKNGGKDNDNKDEFGYGNGFVFKVETDGKYSLIDASHPRILLSACNEINDPFRIDGYEKNDINNRGAGYVQPISKNGVSYLVDANDWESILLENYVDSSYDSAHYLDFYSDFDYVCKNINGNELKSTKSSVLTR